MHKKQLLFLVLFFGSILYMGINTGCSKNGTEGPKGDTGTANVIHSPWITLNMSLIRSDSVYFQSISAPGITQSILDSGVVLTYLTFTGSDGTQSVVNANTYFGQVGLKPGTIELLSFYNYTGLKFRYVIIPGSVAGGRSTSLLNRYTRAQLENMPYSDIITLLQRNGLVSGE
ncbi:hypothetical protein [Deminuibacter soli]|nr:hypothetical protein [Deminuibacter soli]